MKKKIDNTTGRIWYSPDSVEELEKIFMIATLKENGAAVIIAKKKAGRKQGSRKCNTCHKVCVDRRGLASHTRHKHGVNGSYEV